MEWLQPSDHVATQAGFWFGVAGLMLGVGGFAFTWIQLWKTRSAAEAAVAAVRLAQRRVRQAELLVLFERLLNLEDDIRNKVDSGDDGGAAAAFQRWRRAAAECRTVFRALRPDWSLLAASIEAALAMSSAPRSRSGRAQLPLARRYVRALAAVGDVSAQIAGHLPELKAYDGENHGDDAEASQAR